MATATQTTHTSTPVTSTSSATATCVSMAPGPNGYLPPEACGNILLYQPNFGAAIFFTILYGLTLFAHITQGILFRKGYAWVVSMGALWELGAMVFHALQAKHQDNANYNTGYQLLFLLAPLWVNAFLYMTLGRMVNFYDEHKKLGGIKAKRFGSIFVWLDITAFIVQAVGVSITTQTNVATSTIMNGVHIYMGGIGLQEFFILCYISLLVTLHRRLIRNEQLGINIEHLHRGSMPWRWLFYGTYAALFCITVRIIFRLAEYAQGTSTTNPVLTHEAYEYVFDAAPMFLALVLLNVFHPARVINGPDSDFPKISRKEKKEIKRQKKQEKEDRKMAKKYGTKYPVESDSGSDMVPFSNLGQQEQGHIPYYQQNPVYYQQDPGMPTHATYRT